MVKRFTLVGATDKRIIAYPLLKVLMHLGRVLVVTDDALYRRFSEDYSTEFDFENSEFRIVNKLNDYSLEVINQKQSSFEYILFITTDEVPESDKVICVRGIDKGLPSADTFMELENSNYSEVLFTFDKVLDKKALKITPSIKHYMYLTQCEDRKTFLETSDVGYVTLLSDFFGDELGLEKSRIKTVLGKKG